MTGDAGGGVPLGSTSTAARFHRSAVGAVAEMVTGVPAAGVGALRAWVQNVSPADVSTHWCTMVCPAGSVRAMAESQSLPTPYTHEPDWVVVRPTVGAPLPPLPLALAPMPEAPWNATTVRDWS